MDRWIEDLSVSLAEATTRRDLLARLCRAAIGLGMGITALANGGRALAQNGCYLFRGGCGGCSTGSVGCGPSQFQWCDTKNYPCSSSGRCISPCKNRATWYCCCGGGLYRCHDCVCPQPVGLCICQPPVQPIGSC
jgi:hypothetical protein